MTDFELRIYWAPGEMCVGWDRAASLPLVETVPFACPLADGDDKADDIQAERSCPDEVGLLYYWSEPDGPWRYTVTIEADPAGLRRCVRHAH